MSSGSPRGWIRWVWGEAPTSTKREVAVGVSVGVGEGVEVLAKLLGGGLVGGEQAFLPWGLAHVEADGGVGLRVGRGPGNLLQCLGVLCRQLDLDEGHRGVTVGKSLQDSAPRERGWSAQAGG